MTLSELISSVTRTRGNQYDNETLTGWLNEIEHKVINQIINRAEGNNVTFTPYEYAQDSEVILAVPDVHKDIYETYLYAKIDYTNNELDAFNADTSMHSAAWDDYAAEYRREHMPK